MAAAPTGRLGLPLLGHPQLIKEVEHFGDVPGLALICSSLGYLFFLLSFEFLGLFIFFILYDIFNY